MTSRKEGARALASIEDSGCTSIQRLEDYIKKSKERLITANRNSTENTKVNRKNYLKTKMEKKNNCIDISSDKLKKISHKKTWSWLRKRHFKKETKSLLLEA